MLQAKEKFLDRVEQSFILFKDNILSFSLTFIIFNILCFIIVPHILVVVVFSIIPIDNLFVSESTEVLSNMSFMISLLLTIGVLLFLLYVSAIIPVQVALLKSIKQAIYSEKVTPKENIFYGVSRISEIFRVYWYLFVYVFLIPALIFIVWGILLNIGLYNRTDSTAILITIWGVLMWLASIMAIFYSVYRWIRSKFSIITAIDTEDFSKEKFTQSLDITKGKAWRIFWNIFGVAFFGMLLIWVIWGIWKAIGLLGADFSFFSDLGEEVSKKQEFQQMLESFRGFNIFSFINTVIQTSLNTLLGVFITVFTYVFFKRLEQEFGNTEKTSLKEKTPKKIEL